MKSNYGVINGKTPNATSQDMPLAASVAFKALGGKFVTKDGNGNYALSVATDSQIAGWACVSGDYTSSSTAAADSRPIIDDLDAIFELPVDSGDTAITATTLKALIGKTCDLIVTDGIQGADINASTYDVVKIVGGDVDKNTVYVKLNPAKLYTAGVA